MVIVLDESEKRSVFPQLGEASASTSTSTAAHRRDAAPRLSTEEPPPYQEPSYLHAAQPQQQPTHPSSGPTRPLTRSAISPPAAAASPGPSAPSLIFAPSHRGQFHVTTAQWEGPSPPSFFRQAPSDIPRSSFEPMYLTTKKTKLTSGFPMYPPPSPRGRHPFAEMDVTEEDWTWFLKEVNKAVELRQTRGEKYLFPVNDPILNLNKLPIVDFFMDAVSQSHKVKPVGAVVRRWNHHFFGPRHLEVVLAKGSQRLTGIDGPPTSRAFTLPVPIRKTTHMTHTTTTQRSRRSRSSDPSASHSRPEGPPSQSFVSHATAREVAVCVIGRLDGGE
ncbi:hypothetical protein BDV98DRAFT_99605 [Pterulicium gracile]|uniref:Uncharacterized protein n=1 Tax=Pterulicium gracile TaxID=1884261 RepID=A0A5C3QIG0_9AGAR|nr:hypothetical protein BDV98DRAFT_99605 [Pterula gracilis]